MNTINSRNKNNDETDSSESTSSSVSDLIRNTDEPGVPRSNTSPPSKVIINEQRSATAPPENIIRITPTINGHEQSNSVNLLSCHTPCHSCCHRGIVQCRHHGTHLRSCSRRSNVSIIPKCTLVDPASSQLQAYKSETPDKKGIEVNIKPELNVEADQTHHRHSPTAPHIIEVKPCLNLQDNKVTIFREPTPPPPTHININPSLNIQDNTQIELVRSNSPYLTNVHFNPEMIIDTIENGQCHDHRHQIPATNIQINPNIIIQNEEIKKPRKKRHIHHCANNHILHPHMSHTHHHQGHNHHHVHGHASHHHHHKRHHHRHKSHHRHHHKGHHHQEHTLCRRHHHNSSCKFNNNAKLSADRTNKTVSKAVKNETETSDEDDDSANSSASSNDDMDPWLLYLSLQLSMNPTQRSCTPCWSTMNQLNPYNATAEQHDNINCPYYGNSYVTNAQCFL